MGQFHFGRIGILTAALSVAALASPGAASAQTLDDAGLWFAAFSNGEIDFSDDGSTPWLYWFDGQIRLSDDAEGFNQSLVRPGIGRKIADDQALWAGYAWINTQPIDRGGSNFDPEHVNEHRYWQQWTWSPSAGDYRFLHRSRFEQRTIEGSSDVALRLRQLARAQYLLTRGDDACDAGCDGLCGGTGRPEWSLIAWDEVFFNLNDAEWGPQSGLDQNRAFFGVGYKPTADAPVRTEIGYLNQFINSQGGTDVMNHILSVNFFF
ncbi:DUF2490 domain-containing protein [Alienimonas californiensis]|uniref:DUF2490 domain-containing protein n=1 Tax=Alienimonas californiensis TaxID=2527989 RepID=A0A517P640_9PLAN|nr:DUF2490 domain-containing protein [Alienimonas californiensis]QDT14816.1 hypothetical protein CA12_08960 [Alienimonas californiensis]